MAYTTVNNGSLFMNPTLYTGNGSTQSITGVGFQPDFTWIKTRNDTQAHNLIDVVRGVTKTLECNEANAQFTDANGLTAFGSDGFTVGSSGGVNGSGDTLVSWNWKANGAGSANTAGSINSTVSVNTTSGFSIVTFTGTGANATVGHGLGSVPKMIILKSYGGSTNWIVYHNSIGNGKALSLNTTAAESADAGYFNSTTPTSTVFSLGSDGFSNGNGQTMVAYCFAEKQGFSKFGSYTGNGNADGTFVYTGQKSAFIMIKRTDGADTWTMYDNKRLGYNVDNNPLFANANTTESTDDDLDILSNGFKIRRNSGRINTDGANMVYMAFAEAPLVGTNNIPANAR